MATFKTVKNLKTKKQTFYIDGKKVDHDTYDYRYNLYRIKGMQMHSLWTRIDEKAGYIRSGFCFD